MPTQHSTAHATAPTTPPITDIEHLHHLRRLRPAHRRVHEEEPQSLGNRVADRVAAVVGSWRFIITQSVLLTLWIIANALAWAYRWDPYPFILLNLVLSFQAAYTTPIIMMSQNRLADIDRRKAELDYQMNLKAEMEIELVHQKLDPLREQEIARLTALVEELLEARKADERS